MVLITYIIIAVVLFILSGIKIVNQYERGVRFTLGKYAGMMKSRNSNCRSL